MTETKFSKWPHDAIFNDWLAFWCSHTEVNKNKCVFLETFFLPYFPYFSGNWQDQSRAHMVQIWVRTYSTKFNFLKIFVTIFSEFKIEVVKLTANPTQFFQYDRHGHQPFWNFTAFYSKGCRTPTFTIFFSFKLFFTLMLNLR